jgi:hypothetical protein
MSLFLFHRDYSEQHEDIYPQTGHLHALLGHENQNSLGFTKGITIFNVAALCRRHGMTMTFDFERELHSRTRTCQ